MYTKKQKITAFIVCTAFILVTVFSSLFVVRAARHHCIGEKCPICAAIERAESTIRDLGNSTPPPERIYIPTSGYAAFVLRCCIIFAFSPTLVTQKIRMNN